MKKRGLGKGLSELGVSELLSTGATVLSERSTAGDLKQLALHVLHPGKYQPRRRINQAALEELASSIRSQGVIQPLVVRLQDQGYEIIAGERRWRAAKLAGLEQVPVVIKDISDEAALAISLIENIQRQDLNVIEEAVALERLIEEFKMTHQDVAEAVGKSRASVTNMLRLLKLNQDVRAMVEQDLLDMGHARALLALEGDVQSTVANTVVSQALTVRETEEIIRKLLEKADTSKGTQPLESPDVTRLQESLMKRLKASVSIKQNSKGRGKLVIYYKNVDQLNDILQHIH